MPPAATASATLQPTGVVPLAPHEALGAWNADPLLIAGLLALVAGYARGTEILRRRTGRRVVGRRQVAAFVVAVLALAAALVSPLEALAGTLVSAHMVQHLLLLLIAPPLLVVAAPLLPVSWSLPERTRHSLRRLAPSRALRRRLAAPLVIVVALTLHVAVMLGWHAPAFYEAALRNRLVHSAEHVTMLGSAWLVWWLLLRRGEAGRARYGAAVGAVFVLMITGGALGALMTFSGTPWYPSYDTPAVAAWGLGPLQDQQLAGLTVWIVGGGIHMLTAVALFALWLQSIEAGLDRPPGGARRVRAMAGWMVVGVLTLGAGCTTELTNVTPAVVGNVDRGRQLVADYGCVACHAVPDVALHPSRVGPPLEGYANRQSIAGLLPNTPENLATWVENPQEVDPGNLMPYLGVTEADAQDIAAYLLTLD